MYKNNPTYLNNQRPLPQQGFTLVEVMVVVVILSVMAGLVSLSVNGGKARKNRAFYEHLVDSMDYIRLLSAERMQPMGISLVIDESGQLVPKVVQLENAYAHYQQVGNVSAQANSQNKTKNSMELSTNIRTGVNAHESDIPTPMWIEEVEVKLPELPEGVTILFIPLDEENSSQKELQPWFVGQSVPSVLWYGTGQATAVNIEIKYDDRLVGDVIQLLPDGGFKVADEMVDD